MEDKRLLSSHNCSIELENFRNQKNNAGADGIKIGVQRRRPREHWVTVIREVYLPAAHCGSQGVTACSGSSTGILIFIYIYMQLIREHLPALALMQLDSKMNMMLSNTSLEV